MIEVTWDIEEWIPAKNSMSGEGYWYCLLDCKKLSPKNAEASWIELEKTDRKVRLVKVARTVIRENIK